MAFHNASSRRRHSGALVQVARSTWRIRRLDCGEEGHLSALVRGELNLWWIAKSPTVCSCSCLMMDLVSREWCKVLGFDVEQEVIVQVLE